MDAEQAALVDTASPRSMLLQMITGYWVTKLVSEVTRLGIPDALERHGLLTAAELTQRAQVQAHPQALERALRACAALGVVSEDAEARFGPTAISKLLTRDAPGSLKALAEYQARLPWQLWTGLPEALRTGEPQANAQLGMPFFEYLSAHPDSMAEFAEAMKANSFNANHGVLAHYDFSGVRKIVDVGGGLGHLVLALLERYPQLQGIVFDLPDVVAAARRQLQVENPSAAGRLEYAAGDMFAALPAADAYILKMVIHDWDDARGIAILRGCRERLEGDGPVICVDIVLPPFGDVSDAIGKLLDLNIMLAVPGKERTRAEWEALYRAAGLEVTAIIPIPDRFGLCIIEGRKGEASAAAEGRIRT